MQIFFRIGVLKIKHSQNSQENTCVGVSFNKIAGLQACNSIKKKLQHRCFAVKIEKFLRTDFSMEHLWWLLLELREFFCLIYNFEFFCLIYNFKNVWRQLVWHKHNLMISSSVGSGHPGKYSYIWDSPWILIKMRGSPGENSFN